MNDENMHGPPLSGDALALLKAARSGGDAPPAEAKARVRSAVALALAGGAVAGATGAASAAGAQAGGAATASVAAKVATAAASTTTASVATTAATGTAAVGSAAVGTGAAVGFFGGMATKVAIAAIAVSAVGGVIAVRSNETAPRERAPVVEARHVEEGASAPDERDENVEAAAVVAPALEPPAEMPAPVLLVDPGPEAPVLAVPSTERRVARTSASPVEAAPTVEAHPAIEGTPAVPSSLSDELPLIARGRAAIGRRDAAAALRVAREHASRFPAGEMRQDAAAIEVQALCMAHDPGAAAARARFERDYPGSLHAPPIARACR